MSEPCRCSYRRSPDDRCLAPMTQEDGLCDGCRAVHPQSCVGWIVDEAS